MISIEEVKRINFDLDSYEELFTAYKADLDNYIAAFSGQRGDTTEFVKRFLLNKLEDKWRPILGFDAARIKGDVMELQAPKKQDKLTSLTMKQLLNYDDGKSDWLIPNFFSSAGLYILAALPKTGKTILMNMICYATAVSGEFMDRPVQKGKVLYLQLEENIKTMKKRARLAGFGDMTDEETGIVVNFQDVVRIERIFNLNSDLRWLEEMIDEFEPSLVLIDSLRKATCNSEASENTNEFGKMLYALQDVVAKSNKGRGTCCVLVHHMKKSNGRAADPISDLSGHTSISSASDGIIALYKDSEDEDDKVITLRTKPRDGIPLTIRYEIIRNDRGFWRLNKIHEDTKVNRTTVNKILRFLGNNPDQYFTAKTIAMSIGQDYLGKDFGQALDYLDDSELLIKNYTPQKIEYGLSSSSSWLINPKRFKDIVPSEIKDANALMRCRTKRELRELVIPWDIKRQNAAKTLLFQEERDRIKALCFSWEFEVGDRVIYQDKEYTILSRNEEKDLHLRLNEYQLEGLEELVCEVDLVPVSVEDKEAEDDIDLGGSLLDAELTEGDEEEEVVEQELIDALDDLCDESEYE